MRKYMIGYTIWNRQDQIGWALDGIVEHCPTVSNVQFIFDACEDESEKMFDLMAPQLLRAIPFTKQTANDVGEAGTHDMLMRQFMETDCDVLIIMQHDQRFASPAFSKLDEVLDVYGDTIGLIGCRIGYEVNWSDRVGSRWGLGKTGVMLEEGRWAEKSYVNTGPVVYSRSLIEKVGFIDLEFKHWYIAEDYCARSHHEHKLKNVVVDIPIRHMNFGRLKATDVAYRPGIRGVDGNRMYDKWKQLGWRGKG